MQFMKYQIASHNEFREQKGKYQTQLTSYNQTAK